MGDLVTIITLRELGHNTCGMFLPMAILALRHHLVFCLMAEGAIEVFVFGLTRAEQSERLLVTPCAEL